MTHSDPPVSHSARSEAAANHPSWWPNGKVGTVLKYVLFAGGWAFAFVQLLGFHLSTPDSKLDEIARRFVGDSARNQVTHLAMQDTIRQLTQGQVYVIDLAEALAVGECLDRSANELRLMRIDCDDLRRRRPR